MNSKQTVRIASLSVFLFTGFLNAAPIDSIKTNFVGRGVFEAGQFVKAESKGTSIPLNKTWYERVYLQVGFVSEINKRTNLYFIGESQTRYSYFQTKDFLDDDRPFVFFYPHWAEISYSFGAIERPWLRLGAGVFPFKYNPDVRDLGEYLFRTGSYPPIMMSPFDFPLARLTGFRASSITSPLSYLLNNSNAIDSLDLIGIMNTESQFIPLQDYSLSFLGDYTLFHSITLGGGACLSHLWSTNEEYTTPQNNFNKVVDTTTGDTISYTFKATKIMGRVSFDPKPLLGLVMPVDIFGKNDLRFYSEAAVLSLKNYPIYYAERWRRIPFMIGFNFPTFKQLDVLSGELEWYKWNYANSYTDYLFQNLVPRPDDLKPDYDYKENILKWSLYAKRRIGNHFSIIGQVAFDHLRLEQNVYSQQAIYNGEAMHKHGDWAWICKIDYYL
jgi:hypothetical protein